MHNNFKFNTDCILRMLEMFFNRDLGFGDLKNFIGVIDFDLPVSDHVDSLMAEIWEVFEAYREMTIDYEGLKAHLQGIMERATPKTYKPEDFEN